MSYTIQGKSIIGYSRSGGGGSTSSAVNPASGQKLDPEFHAPSESEVEQAVLLAERAFPVFSSMSGKKRAGFLRAIAAEIESAVDQIAERGPLETGLPEARMRGETARTTGQLRMFADLIEEGSWVDARIEHAQPDRAPLPKPDLRSMQRPLGPVAVFCASNFPLAFSVAGGDTAAALAAGCPVLVKAHSSHPGIAEIVGDCVVRAAQATDMPEGVFSLLYGSGRDVGMSLVKHPVVQAVGFTGSRSGGLALMDAAANRPQPIPVYAEMSSVNPVVLMPKAVDARGEALAEGLFGSLTLGAGQFCTNPGLVFLPDGHGEAFLAKLKELIEVAPSAVMLNSGICQAFKDATESFGETEGVETVAHAFTKQVEERAVPVVFSVNVRRFLEEARLHGEMFGPGTLIVRGSMDEIEATIPELEGQLTATVHGTEEEIAERPGLIGALERRAGRLIFNGFPTGVEVCPSMVHGGPFPSTSDGRSTSVGTMAIHRFCRPVAWQGFPAAALPEELRDGNPLGIQRMVDGEFAR
ncbi:aldehyde dehydrogenase (NADP(+)) [Haloferula rosea]|uniref:Aldehyde dehydrogenase (NADP(+)) n=1 Tax=Haloferula rosea TaxID=490093 RepID=A0A934VGZ3_9BACT|nr:aldehyde dehydrogenase (NADP(+)) [Haloferula rosea]MBK1828542.1 aldehyde dehydrogenase (NADP(+)) [Haloferula rosea]